MSGPEIARFWSKVDQRGPSECWIWTASLQLKRGGYGQFRIGRTIRRAHIVAYELLVGPVPQGLVLDHICRTPACVNPAHLDPVTLAENTRRGMAPSAIAFRTNHCQRGHAYTAENTIRKRSGKRECRECANDGQRRRRAARRAA